MNSLQSLRVSSHSAQLHDPYFTHFVLLLTLCDSRSALYSLQSFSNNPDFTHFAHFNLQPIHFNPHSTTLTSLTSVTSLFPHSAQLHDHHFPHFNLPPTPCNLKVFTSLTSLTSLFLIILASREEHQGKHRDLIPGDVTLPTPSGGRNLAVAARCSVGITLREIRAAFHNCLVLPPFLGSMRPQR